MSGNGIESCRNMGTTKSLSGILQRRLKRRNLLHLAEGVAFWGPTFTDMLPKPLSNAASGGGRGLILSSIIGRAPGKLFAIGAASTSLSRGAIDSSLFLEARRLMKKKNPKTSAVIEGILENVYGSKKLPGE